MISVPTELMVNLLESAMFLGFLTFFFKRKYSKRVTAVGFTFFTLILFATVTFFSFRGYLNVNAINLSGLDQILYIVILAAYTFLFLSGDTKSKLLMPLISMVANAIVSCTFGYMISLVIGLITHTTYDVVITQSLAYQYSALIIVHIVDALVFWLLIKHFSGKLKITEWTDTITFVVIPLLSFITIMATLPILVFVDHQLDVIPYLTIICFAMTIVTIITWVMMYRISKDNEIKTKLLLTQQREELYESNILQSHAQIEKISKIKHDMKNNLLCIGRLIKNEKYGEAESLCSEFLDDLTKVYTPINTENPLLNAVVNVEQEKALGERILFKVEITDDLIGYAKNSDIISLVGNLCDNAIEHLKTLPRDNRRMSLKITSKNDYCVIACKNKIKESVLGSNPDLKTSKDDKENHGKGTNILKSIAEKYDGTVTYDETDGYLTVVVMLKSVKNDK